MDIKSDEAKGKKKKNELSQPHDLTFKKLFGELEIAKDVIENNLPKEVLDQLDMDSLEKLDGSFINERLKETFTDILYGVRIGDKDAYVALLFEHKSYADKQAIFQVAGYIIDVWSKIILEGKKELPVVIPLIIYHGEYNWNYKRDIREMIPDFDILPEYLKQMLPVLKHEFINIKGYTEEDIREYKPITRMVLRAFKYIYEDKDKLIETFIISVDELGLEVSKEDFNRYADTILLYFSSFNSDIREEDIVQKIQELGGKGERIMTILQEREQKGIEEGIILGMQQGKKEGIQEGIKTTAKAMIIEGESIDKIMKYTKLTMEQIEEVKEEMMN